MEEAGKVGEASEDSVCAISQAKVFEFNQEDPWGLRRSIRLGRKMTRFGYFSISLWQHCSQGQKGVRENNCAAISVTRYLPSGRYWQVRCRNRGRQERSCEAINGRSWWWPVCGENGRSVQVTTGIPLRMDMLPTWAVRLADSSCLLLRPP